MHIALFKRLAIVSALLLAGGAESAAARVGPDGKLGASVIDNVGEVDMSSLPAFSMSHVPVLAPLHPRYGVSDAEYAARKARAATPETAGAMGTVGRAPSGQAGRQTPGISVGFAAQSENGPTPSDMALAVGPTDVVQVVNSAIAVYDRTGVLRTGFPKALSTFFPGTSGDLGDPRAFYDPGAKRFVVEADDFTAGVIQIALSETSNPSGTWWLYSFAPWGAADCRTTGTNCIDFPRIGFDDSTLYLSITEFFGTGGLSNWMVMLPKAKMYKGSGISYYWWSNLTWGGVAIDSLQPVELASAAEHPRAGFALASFNINFGGGQCVNGCNGLMVWAFSNNLVAAGTPGPEFSGISIATANTYALPPSANEPGCAYCIDTGDVRISATPIYHGGVIAASLNTKGSDARSHALWFQVRPFLNDSDTRCTGSFTDDCPQVTGAQLLNEDCYFCGGQGTNGSSYYGALAPDQGGDLTMTFAFSDDNTYPEGAYVSRRVTQAMNTMHDGGVILCGGGGKYVQGRWGDYFATSADFSNAAKDYMWFAADNSLSNGNWGTCIGANGFTAVNQP